MPAADHDPSERARLATVSWRRFAASARNVGAVVGVALVLSPWAWGLVYGVSLSERMNKDVPLLLFCAAVITVIVAATLGVMSALIRPHVLCARLDRVTGDILYAATWLLVTAMLAWFARHAGETYEVFGAPPSWLMRCEDGADLIAPGAGALACYFLAKAVFGDDGRWRTPTDGIRPACPRDPARN